MKTVANRLIPSALALAVSAVAVPMSAQAAGFVEDTTANLNLRNYYFNRNFLNNTQNNQGHAEAWSQSFILDVRSGFTEGTVGFGVDVLGLQTFKLDGGRGTNGSQLTIQQQDGEQSDHFSRLAVAAKAKVSKTELKIGEWAAVNPMLRSDDGRALPQTFKGAQVVSNEFAGLSLTAARFNGNSQRNDGSMERMSIGLNGKTYKSSAFDVVGGEYRFNNNQTMVGAWRSELQDIYQQNYLQLTHTQPVGDWVLGANLGFFEGREDGAEKAGKLDNKVYQGMFSAKHGMHTFYVGLQHVKGDTKFLRIDGASGGSLVNDGFTNSYDNPNERSWQLRHDYNFAGLGVPGLTMMNRYVSADNINAWDREDTKEWGRESELAYTIQSGTFKNMSVRWRNSDVRRAGGLKGADLHENRLIVNFPINLL